MRGIRGAVLLTLGAVVVLALDFVAPASAQEEKSFTFPEVVIDATVLPDGSMDLVEHRTFLFTGGAFSVGTFDRANTSAKSSRPASAGSNRLTEFSVVGEPLVAVPAAKSMPVWKIPWGWASLTATNPPVDGS